MVGVGVMVPVITSGVMLTVGERGVTVSVTAEVIVSEGVGVVRVFGLTARAIKPTQ
jgi:hypothetical protein